jgi:hypothetical protein
MTAFQIIVLPILAALLVVELFALVRMRNQLLFRFTRMVAWLAGGLAVAFPAYTQRLAMATGIGRGVDFVVYTVCLALVGAVFYLLSQHITLERRLTELVRRQAIAESRRGGEA